MFGFEQRNKRLSYPPSLQNSSTDKKTKSNAKPIKTRDIYNIMICEEDNKRGHSVAHYLEGAVFQTAPQKTGRHWQRRPEVQGLLERKNQDASERNDLLKSRQGIG